MQAHLFCACVLSAQEFHRILHTSRKDTSIPLCPGKASSISSMKKPFISFILLFWHTAASHTEHTFFVFRKAESAMLLPTCPIVTHRCKLQNTAYFALLHRQKRRAHCFCMKEVRIMYTCYLDANIQKSGQECFNISNKKFFSLDKIVNSSLQKDFPKFKFREFLQVFILTFPNLSFLNLKIDSIPKELFYLCIGRNSKNILSLN